MWHGYALGPTRRPGRIHHIRTVARQDILPKPGRNILPGRLQDLLHHNHLHPLYSTHHRPVHAINLTDSFAPESFSI